jgi:hypothetical protein
MADHDSELPWVSWRLRGVLTCAILAANYYMKYYMGVRASGQRQLFSAYA